MYRDLIIPYVNRYSYSFINSFGERVSDDSSPLREACVENMKRVLPYINTMITNLQSLYTELSNHVSVLLGIVLLCVGFIHQSLLFKKSSFC